MQGAALIPRFLAAALLMAAGYMAITRNAASALARVDPIKARSLASDARIDGKAAFLLIQSGKTPADRTAADALAQKALTRDATVVSATVARALFFAMRGDETSSGVWFDYSEKLSRRDFTTQLYLIEKAVGEGNIDGALLHYDTAMRASYEATNVLYPILVAASGNPEVRQPLTRVLLGRPLWSSGLIAYLAANGTDYAAVGQLFLDLRRGGYAIPSETESVFLNNMVAHGKLTDAWRYYVATHPAERNSLIRNGDFQPAKMTNSPFEWQLSVGEGMDASLVPGGRNGVLDYHLYPAVGGTTAKQFTFAPAGKIRLQSVVAESSQEVGEGPYWELKCADGRAIGVLEIGKPRVAGQPYATELTVPGNCPVQLLSLIVRSSDDVQGATGQIDSVGLIRL
ncbi:MAG: hypothetical protein J0J06_14870 [Sphingomonas sp.]|uniref:hypothetical protein n=1 Tax=Sphingomonas sp. TaxID=28214 RepID=UPI001AC7353D|nr:hypothetical protein [Sphingomonas sp.]MBN8816716.1 hypothetical protein [Sphingomonas sp.]